MQERLPMARMWCRDAKDYMEELDRLKKEQDRIRKEQRTGESPSSNSSGSTDGNYKGAEHWARIGKRLGLTDFGRTEDDTLNNDTHSVTDIRHLDHASEPSSPQAMKSESEEANVGTPSSFTSINRLAQNGATPKAMEGQMETGPYPQSYQNNAYGQTFAAPTNGANGYPPPALYHHSESKERDTLAQSMYNPNMTTVMQPHMNTYNTGSYHGPTDWAQGQSATWFGVGNSQEMMHIMGEPPVYDISYPTFGNGTTQQHPY
jgi:hypothetical protein